MISIFILSYYTILILNNELCHIPSSIAYKFIIVAIDHGQKDV